MREARQRLTIDIPVRLHKILLMVAKRSNYCMRELVERAIEKTYHDPIEVQRDKCKRLNAEFYRERELLSAMEDEKNDINT